MLFDPSLTPLGISEAIGAAESLLCTIDKIGKWPQLFLVSPLTRALQTATNIYQSLLTSSPSSPPAPMFVHEGCRYFLTLCSAY